MVYKSLNTFIDDLFAFVVKMPWMHRIACLRDDVIFIIFIIQRAYYPVDKSRRNEVRRCRVRLNCKLRRVTPAFGCAVWHFRRGS